MTQSEINTVYCPSCGKSTQFKDDKIPYGAKYEVVCGFCGMKIVKKKLIAESLRDRSMEKQKIVMETGYKTARRE